MEEDSFSFCFIILAGLAQDAIFAARHGKHVTNSLLLSLRALWTDCQTQEPHRIEKKWWWRGEYEGRERGINDKN
jgi:hypothetical protein